MQPTFENGLYYKPGKKVLIYFITTRFIPVVIACGIIAVAISFLEKFIVNSPQLAGYIPFDPKLISSYGVPGLVTFGVLVLLFIVLTSYIQYSSVTFMFDEFAFHVSSGLISKSEIAMPYRQIQTVNHAQSFNEKTWGITRVIVETAGTNDAHSAKSWGDLPILDTATAAALEQELLRRASGK